MLQDSDEEIDEDSEEESSSSESASSEDSDRLDVLLRSMTIEPPRMKLFRGAEIDESIVILHVA